MRILHIADIHIGFGYPGPDQEARVNDIKEILDYVADYASSMAVDVVVMSGDAFKDANIGLNRASKEIIIFVNWLRLLSSYGIKVIVISGTPSHDAIAAYELIKEMNIPLVQVHTTPATVCIDLGDDAEVFHLIPGMNRSNMLAQDELKNLQPHEAHELMTEKITQLCRNMALEPGYLVSHLTYAASDNGFSDLLMQNEAILTTEAASLFKKVFLGHIHRPQQAGNVYYCGSPERLSFNEENITPGFWIHDTGTDESKFVETPARPYQTIEMDQDKVQASLDCGYTPKVIPNSIVRVQYTCSEEMNKRFNRKALEAALLEAGAWYVQEIKGEIQNADRTRDKEVTESIGPVKAVALWGKNNSLTPEQTAELCAGTEELLSVLASK